MYIKNPTQRAFGATACALFTLAVLMAATPALAQIVSETSASSDSGGNAVGTGGSAITGSASASARTTSVAGSGIESGSVEVDVEITANGQAYEESIQKNIPAGGGVHVQVSADTSARTGGDALLEEEAMNTADTPAPHSWFEALLPFRAKQQATSSEKEMSASADEEDRGVQNFRFDALSGGLEMLRIFFRNFFGLFLFR